jgi:bifunctional DNA-binding transcriptional regulator/antitoxin component of YhaV-PrlF toxin-antitoxin module
MELKTMKLGTRSLQQVTGGHAINIPMVLIDSFGLKQGDKFEISATTDGTITLKQAIE